MNIMIYEVFKVVLLQRDESDALQSVALIQQGFVVDLTSSIAIRAAKMSVDHRLPMSIGTMLATARTYRAVLRTPGFRLQKARWRALYRAEGQTSVTSACRTDRA